VNNLVKFGVTTKVIYWATRFSQASVHLGPFCFHVVLATATEGGEDLFLQEIEFMKQIGSHRNVLSMLGYWVKSEPIMLILEYVKGKRLENRECKSCFSAN